MHALSHLYHKLMLKADNNASYPLPTELTTNATYNMVAEEEYETDKTGKLVNRNEKDSSC